MFYPYPRVQLNHVSTIKPHWHLVVCQLWLSKQSFPLKYNSVGH